jgi:hypothetical protein
VIRMLAVTTGNSNRQYNFNKNCVPPPKFAGASMKSCIESGASIQKNGSSRARQAGFGK